MRMSVLPIALMILAGGMPRLAGMDLHSATLAGWNRYVREADARMQDRAQGRAPFLWTDENAARQLRVRRGEVVVAPAHDRGTAPVAHGLIHHWVGAVFIPGATIRSLSRVIHDYKRYQDVYRPVVATSDVVACTPSNQAFSMVWQRHVMFVNAAIAGRYQARDYAVDRQRGFNIAEATEVREIEEYGQSNEHLLPPDTGSGFVWRLHSIARYEERDGGVYFEMEALALTRDIPAALRWIVAPVVNRLSLQSLATMVAQTRDAVRALPAATDEIALCGDAPRFAARSGGER